MSSQTTQPSQPNIDPYQRMQIIHNPDDTLTRLANHPRTSPSSNTTLSVLTKDVPINQSKNTFIRFFLPGHVTTTPTSNHKKLPLVVFFHGGAFIFQSAASTRHHELCAEMAFTVEAVLASVDYRLAPEHRIPAAHEDAVEALHWISSSQDDWLTQYADYSNCYLMGGSAGGNLAFYAGLHAASQVKDLEPLKIRGLILRQPFFGGTRRTGSELRLENDRLIPMCVCDLAWELALPIGVDRDYEYCNPMAVDGLDEKLEKMKELGWRVLVSGNGEDPLVDRAKEFAELMAGKGVQVIKDFHEEGNHEIEYREPSKANELIELVKGFIFPFGA